MMNIHTKIKILILLCALPVSHAFTAQPVAPNSLDAKFAAIDAMPDLEVLCAAPPLKKADAERFLAQSRDALNEFLNLPLAHKQAVSRRLGIKRNTVHYELKSCNDVARRQKLLDEYNRLSDQLNTADKEELKCLNSCVDNGTLPVMYKLMAERFSVMANQVALLLAQKEQSQQREVQLQREKMQWQQEKEQLQQRQAQLEQREVRLQQEKIQLEQQLRGYQQSAHAPQDAPPPYEQ